MNSNSFDKLLRQVVVVPVSALLVTAAILVWQVFSFNRTVSSIESSDQLIANTIQIAGLVVDQETSVRGFQLTGDRVFLDPYQKSNLSLQDHLARLKSAESTPNEKLRVAHLQNDYNEWLSTFAVPLIRTVEAGGTTIGPELNLQGKRRMDSIRNQISSLTETAQVHRDQRVALWKSQVQNLAIALILIALAVGLMIGLYVRSLLHRVSAAYRQSHRALSIRAEQTFRSEEKLRTTMESIADGVITCDPAGCVQTMNTVARELTGWSLEDALNQPLEQVFKMLDELTRKPATSPVENVKNAVRPAARYRHTILVRRDGTELFIQDRAAPIRDKLGNLIGIVLVFQDVTLEKKSQEALLANEKLAVAGRLSATIAHEIHNPLDSVSNILYLMAANTRSGENVQLLDLARQEITRVTQISRAMLSLYRESRTPVSIDLKEMVESVLLLLNGRFRKLGVRVLADVPDRLSVSGFPAELRQVFTNLLTNAVEASSDGDTVEVIARPSGAAGADPGPQRPAGALIKIIDHGAGIPDQVREDLFKPFFSTKGEKGTGLGLWISKGIILKHGGTLELTSAHAAEDHGTTATVFLACEPPLSALTP